MVIFLLGNEKIYFGMYVIWDFVSCLAVLMQNGDLVQQQ